MRMRSSRCARIAGRRTQVYPWALRAGVFASQFKRKQIFIAKNESGHAKSKSSHVRFRYCWFTLRQPDKSDGRRHSLATSLSNWFAGVRVEEQTILAPPTEVEHLAD